MISYEAGNSIMRFDAERSEGIATSANLFSEVVPGHSGASGFCGGNYSGRGWVDGDVCWIKKIFGKVEEGALEEVRAGEHGSIFVNHLV